MLPLLLSTRKNRTSCKGQAAPQQQYGAELSFPHFALLVTVDDLIVSRSYTVSKPFASVKILTRYVLSELLQVFLLTLAGLTALIFLALVAKEAVSKGIGLGPLLRMTPYLLPQAMQFAVPGTMLLATTSVYGRMSASNEVVAAKSMGISPWALARPAFVLAFLVSLGAVALNDLAVSWGRLGVQRVFVESLEEVIYGQLRLHRSYGAGDVQISVRQVEGKRLIQPAVTIAGKEGEENWFGSAAEAEIRSFPNERKLVITFKDADIYGKVDATLPSNQVQEISFEQLLGDKSRSRSASNYALSEIGAETRATNEHLANLHRQELTESTLAMMTGDFERVSAEQWKPIEDAIRGAKRRQRRLAVEPYRRWATAFSCLCFVMVGVPMSVIRQKGEFLASFFMCFLPILLVYYPLLIVSVDNAKSGDVPPVTVWLGNVVLAVWGLWMMRKVVRH